MFIVIVIDIIFQTWKFQDWQYWLNMNQERFNTNRYKYLVNDIHSYMCIFTIHILHFKQTMSWLFVGLK